MLEEKLAKALKGTTTVGIRTSKAVVLAADKRATAGNMVVHKNVKKIVPVSDYVAITTAGLVADAQMLTDWVSNQIRYYQMTHRKRMSVKAIVTLLSNTLFASRLFPYVVQFIVGGYDTAPRLYTLDWYGSIAEEDFLVTGSGSPMAAGVIEAEYREDLGPEEAEKLAIKAVLSATRRDPYSGEGIDVAVITEKGIEKYKTYKIVEALKLVRGE